MEYLKIESQDSRIAGTWRSEDVNMVNFDEDYYSWIEYIFSQVFGKITTSTDDWNALDAFVHNENIVSMTLKMDCGVHCIVTRLKNFNFETT